MPHIKMVIPMSKYERMVEGFFWLLVIIVVTVVLAGVVLDYVVPQPAPAVGWNA